MSGTITVFTGTMYSGKSTALIQEAEKQMIAKKKVAFIRPKLDSRDFLSRTIKSIPGLEVFKVDRIEEIPQRYTYDTLLFDEFHFHSVEFAQEVNKLANEGINIFIAGLNASAEQKLFPSMTEILPMAETILKFNAVCPSCGNYSASIVLKTNTQSSDFSVSEDNVDDGSEENPKYFICCRNCYTRLKKKYKPLEKSEKVEETAND